MQGPFSGKIRKSLYDEPLNYRASVLPLGTYGEEGEAERLGFAWPGFLADTKEAAEIPGRYLSGDASQAVTPEDAQRTGLNTAGLMMGGGGMLAGPAERAAGGELFANGSKGGAGVGATLVDSPHPGFDGWHGSPHDFDKFDFSKIGTGEGAERMAMVGTWLM